MSLHRHNAVPDCRSTGSPPEVWLGRIEYGAAWELQRELVELRRAGRIPDTLLLLEHPRTITLGRRSKEADLLEPRDSLKARGFAIYDVDRGGEVTYHGPGQLVGYPILDLNDHGRDLHAHIRKIEEALIRAIEPFGIRGIRNPPHTGVWVEDRKIAAIGIKVSRWVTSHGFALNVSTDLSDFEMIVPCGIRDFGVTSVEAESEVKSNVSGLIPRIIAAFEEEFDLESSILHSRSNLGDKGSVERPANVLASVFDRFGIARKPVKR